MLVWTVGKVWKEDIKQKMVSSSVNKDIERERTGRNFTCSEKQLREALSNIAELAADVVSLRKEILCPKEELKARNADEESVLKTQGDCSEESQEAEEILDQMEDQ